MSAAQLTGPELEALVEAQVARYPQNLAELVRSIAREWAALTEANRGVVPLPLFLTLNLPAPEGAA